ncbi:hypothetical protein SAMN05428642_101209 [Flaviramulus basaltis]|uniref:Uncharacterized protein n=1 Tax=Flaviramulus basaltis TaxID=369401 RepID=A0A1K2IAD8_9FLAO|nr:hypothetical protein [Flaviramulus basaltis]SFZ89373.1 hypothetical protein SAMN05428642_101209 [Flaviramulus basaltis]
MKTKFLFMLSGLVLSVFTLTSFKNAPIFNTIEYHVQDAKVINAVYDGHEDYGYNFITKNEDGDEHTLTFQQIEEDILKAFDLNSDDLVGAKFKVTYTTEVEVTIDSDGYEEEEEVNIISKLEKL